MSSSSSPLPPARQDVDARTRELQTLSSSLVAANAHDPRADLAAERARASFSSSELAAHLAGGPAKLARRRELADQLSRLPWADKSRRYFLTREEEYVGGLRAALGVWRKMKGEALPLEDGLAMRALVDWPSGLELHIGMFIPTLLSQATPQQQAVWLPQAYDLRVVGTYAQTELGHGTFVRGLETTATYDAATREFVVHSPTLTSTKWWPGGLAKTSTHAVVMARLVTPDGRERGPHAFVVPLRDPDTHLPLPGVTVGDIGPKFGYNGVDNGFLRFDHVRVPRDHMLMRYASVDEQGQYKPPPAANAKAAYATMVYVRADIVRNAGGVMARAATISTRYAAVRRQTAVGAAGRELQVLDYQNVAAELLPRVAAAYALTFMGDAMMGMYRAFERDRDRGEFGALPELHALSSGLKAVCTWQTADGVEACRRCCGGHGYSRLSGLPDLFSSYVQNVTWEGDNNVLCLQTARYLLKAMVGGEGGGGGNSGNGNGNSNKSSSGSSSSSAAYLSPQGLRAELASKCPASGEACWNDLSVVVAALRHRACRLGVAALEELRRNSGGGGGGGRGGAVAFEGPGWNATTVDLIRFAVAHCELVLVQTFAEAVDARARGESGGSSSGSGGGGGGGGKKVSPPAVAALGRLAALYGLTVLEQRALPELLGEPGYLSAAQLKSLRARSRGLLREVRPDAVALVDAFAFPDYQLNSALGREDGDVYSALLSMAQGSPLNATAEGPAWHGVLEPAMRQARQEAAAAAAAAGGRSKL
jgi:acyl-CoA oxidase